jgi:hypothetical protein
MSLLLESVPLPVRAFVFLQPFARNFCQRFLTELIPPLFYAQSSNGTPKHPKGAGAMNGIQQLLPDRFAILRWGEFIIIS